MKYRNAKQSLDGHSFASKLEAAVYLILKMREKAGELILTQVQAHIYLTDARIAYVADFKCADKNGNDLYIEAKGLSTPVWAIKKKLYKFYGKSPLEIWTGHWSRPSLSETIFPIEASADSGIYEKKDFEEK